MSHKNFFNSYKTIYWASEVLFFISWGRKESWQKGHTTGYDSYLMHSISCTGVPASRRIHLNDLLVRQKFPDPITNQHLLGQLVRLTMQMQHARARIIRVGIKWMGKSCECSLTAWWVGLGWNQMATELLYHSPLQQHGWGENKMETACVWVKKKSSFVKQTQSTCKISKETKRSCFYLAAGEVQSHPGMLGFSPCSRCLWRQTS